MMNKEQLQDIFRQSYSADKWQELLISLFGASEIRQTPSTLTSDSNEKVEGFKLGRLYTADRYEIGLFAFEIKQGHNVQLNRVGLRSLVRSYTRYNVDAALVVYYDATHWRLSFICDIKEQKTAPKRYTYVFGNPNESYRTASAMLAKLADGKSLFENIKAAFSVEALSKDFFKGYKEQYGKFCKYIGGEQKWQRDYVKKMMGRLVFLQFLQKKGWMGCGAAQADWTDGDLQYTQNLIKRYEGNEKLLSDILESLFFDTLNTKREGDIVDPKLGDNIKIPYLNGGLFDKDKLDEKQIDFPYSYFAELMDFFSQYNFTIDENDPYDAEVGIDPEMLGHIFENLLEDNKDKGAFYTPKEIVQYMCRQSLIEYLQSKLGKHTEIENFINNHDTGNTLDSKNYVATNAKAIEELLDSVKVCDPAIGSGAFPMGILNEIFHAKMALNMTLNRAEVKKNIIQNSIYGVDIEQGAVDIARLRFWLALVVDDNEPQPLPNLDYKIMCGNSLLSRYALDMPFEDVFKEYNKGKSESERMSLAKYKQLVADYTNTSDHTQKAGFRITIENIKSVFRTELSRDEKEKFAKLKGQIIDIETPLLFGERTKKEQEELKKLKIKFAKQEQEQADIVSNKLYENAFEWRFEFPQLLDDDGNFVGFDIVIGNPPYGFRNVLTAEDKAYFRKVEKINFPSGDSAELFTKKSFDRLVNENGILSFIIPKKSLYGDAWESLRIDYWSKYNLCFILDTGKSFEDVLLEASAFGLRKHIPTGHVQLAFLKEDKQIERFSSVPFEKVLNSANTLQIYSILYSETMLNKIVSNSMVGNSRVEGKLGLAIGTDFYSDTPKEFKLLKGIDVGRYNLKGSRYLNNQEQLNWVSANEFMVPKVLCQRLIAHIQNPTPHLKFAACYDDEGILITNTIMSFDLPDTITPKFFVAYLNSSFLAWYAYNFVYSRAIRGMDLYNFYIQQLPIPIISKEAQQPFIELVNEIVELKRTNIKADTSALEREIDTMVYALYNLTEEEIAIIEK